MTPDTDQAAAIDLACRERTLVLTGGPGVGKSQTLLWILKAWRERCGVRTVQLCAPTGKAAKRMRETTGEPASTIHRLLASGAGADCGDLGPANLGADAIVVDEGSMLDVFLCARLLQALDDDTRILFVGDVDQLPSIGCGQVLRDLITAGALPVARLTQLHRQTERSYIHANAQAIREGVLPELDNSRMDDCRFVDAGDGADGSPETAFRLAVEAAVAAYTEHGDATVLAPMRKESRPLSTVRFNVALQARLNPAAPGKAEMEHGWIDRGGGRERLVLRVGDRVRHTVNDYEIECEDGTRGVFNGEVGRVLSLVPEQRRGGGKRPIPCEVRVDYGDRVAKYSSEQASEIVLAYASTIHAAQGSEWPVVVVVCHSTDSFMLGRSLLYTAITRAKAKLVIVGDREGVAAAVRNDRSSRRLTTLAARLRAEAAPC